MRQEPAADRPADHPVRARRPRRHAALEPGPAPPGWYLVVVVDTDGIPSTGQWLHLNPDAPAPV
ncbi:galactose oxidase-like domain-containing protein [Nocardia sp. NPDC051981]|uniref:galactose oxidase-like domain-containing protein n=1 Tax=Nocardia sp. NPDC051981 TaxID=3155417 RepID=UPI0034255E05